MATELTRDQKQAEKLIEQWFKKSDRQTFVLTGYAGTGKTTLLKHVVCSTLSLKPEVQAAFVTPTGKAATVLIRSGIPACTLHRLIYQTKTEEVETLVNGKKYMVEKLTFRRRESIDKDIKLIVLDEFSMVSDEVLGDIMRFGVKILLCGDDAQLPPVEGENSFIGRADAHLGQIVRQQEDNPVIMLSQMAREGRFIPEGRYSGKAFVINSRRTSAESRKRLLLKADQIICGINKTRNKINDEVRTYLGRGALPEAGDKLICTANNWEQFIDDNMQFNLVNGIIGEVKNVRYTGGDIGFMRFKADFMKEICADELPFDTGIFYNGYYRYKHGDYFEQFDGEGNAVGAYKLNRFEYGYCISCHKAQGSEFDSVIVFDESYAFKEDRARWLYTAITRAREKLIIIR